MSEEIKARLVGLSPSYEEKYPTEVSGESSYRANIEKICGLYDEDEGYKDDSHLAALFLENDNQFDSNAVRVTINDLTVGYLSKPAAKAYRQRLAELGAPENAIGVCTASIRGGFRKKSGDIADFGVRLDFELASFKLDRVRYEGEWLYPAGVKPPANQAEAGREVDPTPTGKTEISPQPLPVTPPLAAGHAPAASKPQGNRRALYGAAAAFIGVSLCILGCIFVVFILPNADRILR